MKLTLIERSGSLTLNELASVLRAMPVLEELYLMVNGSSDTSFARPACLEVILPLSLVELHCSVIFVVPLSAALRREITSDESASFRLKIINQTVYTVPWKWSFLDLSIPLCDYEPKLQRSNKNVWVWQDNRTNNQLMAALQPWRRVRTVESRVQIPSVSIFSRLRELVTWNNAILHTALPSTLRSLELIGMNCDQKTFIADLFLSF